MSSAREFAEIVAQQFVATGNLDFLGKVIEARDAALLRDERAPGPCGKHPKMFWLPVRTVDCMSGDGPEYACTVCADLARERERLQDEIDELKSEADRILAILDRKESQ
jgi:hypothetical protein